MTRALYAACMTTKSPVGTNIKRLRLERGLTHKKAADELGIYIRTLQKWERGESEPNWMYLKRLSEFYEVPVPDLFKPAEES